MSNHSGLESRLEYSKIIQSSYGSPSTIRGFRSINAGRTFSSLETSRSPGPTTLGVVQPRHSRSASECRPVVQQELEGRLRTVSIDPPALVGRQDGIPTLNGNVWVGPLPKSLGPVTWTSLEKRTFCLR